MCATRFLASQTSDYERDRQGRDDKCRGGLRGSRPWHGPAARRTACAASDGSGLSKKFKGATVYDDFSIDLPVGRFISIFDPNGCGKSTLINMISGLISMDAGEVLYDGQTIRDTKTSYVFQNYREALFLWLRAIDNIHYPLEVMGIAIKDLQRRVEKLLADFDLPFDLNQYPYALSGGQQQTVAILRALVTEPEVLFLDEPFSALYYEMTLFMRERLQHIFMKLKTTMLLVSHDLEEAIQLADQVVLLSRRPTRVAGLSTLIFLGHTISTSPLAKPSMG